MSKGSKHQIIHVLNFCGIHSIPGISQWSFTHGNMIFSFVELGQEPGP